jgi:hypothetical protein
MTLAAKSEKILAAYSLTIQDKKPMSLYHILRKWTHLITVLIS